ncbi:ABC transporter permease [Roseivirga sp. E12]|uniref:ABC transporter permease n=1 Tax=Roseivirga sp. E12 TaxID=2819237 RepID=UPI001ABCF7A0|nr:ABC transporter permease [Roseivirga sp. E12]MBO3698061.1 ABC transporter permease [Roseivirga sp. E12]
MKTPHKWVLKLLHSICPEELQEGITGDLIEQYDINRGRNSKLIANWLFIFNGLQFISLSMLQRRNQYRKPKVTAMIFSYLKTTFRNIRKQSAYYSINYVGLAMGLTCCALAILYVKYELSYDDFHQDPKNTYRVTGEINNRAWFPSIQNIYAERLMDQPFPEVKKIAKFRRTPQQFAIYGDQRFPTRTLVTNPGSDLFDILSFKSLEGDPDQMLEEPNSVVMTESSANALLGDSPHLGKIIKWDSLTLKVSGVLEDIPDNSHLTFNFLVAAEVDFYGVFTIMQLQEGADIEALEDKIVSLDIPDNQFPIKQIALQPIREIHLAKPLTFELKPPGDRGYLLLFSGVALFILIISCTNYINLSTAIYAGRTKEVAIRKVLGSSKRNLNLQFMSESVLLAFLTLPLVILMVELLLPTFRNFVEVELTNEFLTSIPYISTLLAITLGVGLISGVYPVLTMTHFSPLKLFRNKNFVGSHRMSLRKILLTLQFTLLLFLGAGAYFINQQLRFIQNKDLGIAKEGIIKVSNAYNIRSGDQYSAIKNQALSNPNILGFTNGMPPGTENYGQPYQAEGHEIKNDALSFGTDLDYFEVMEVDGVSGDIFEKGTAELPRVSLLVNEKFVETIGWDNPIGKKITFNPGRNNQRDRLVAGVFKDYHTLSLHNEVVPQFIFVRNGSATPSENILIKINGQDIRASLEAIEKAWYGVLPNVPIEYEFMEEDMQAAYAQEERAGKLSLILSTLAILLAVMGLVGLAAYMAQLRIKEVGIRKVLGASTGQIMFLLNKEFILLVGLATLIGGALCFYTLNAWLETFAYRTSINILVFPLMGTLVFLITFLTVSAQSASAALQNPIKALRHE